MTVEGWIVKAKIIRHCIECGKQHNTGIEDRMEGTFEPVDTCVDCLMGKCSFNFEKTQVTLDEAKGLTYDEYHQMLGEKLVEILQKTYWNPPDEICDLPESEHRPAG